MGFLTTILAKSTATEHDNPYQFTFFYKTKTRLVSKIGNFKQLRRYL